MPRNTPVRRGSILWFFFFHFFGGHPWEEARIRLLLHRLSSRLLLHRLERAFILSDRNIFYTPRGGGNGGVTTGAFLVFHFFGVGPSWCLSLRACILSYRFTPPSGRGLVIFFLFCRRGHLPQTSARSKQYLPVMLVRLALFRQNFHESWCRKLLAI